jgi:hypothetical protein
MPRGQYADKAKRARYLRAWRAKHRERLNREARERKASETPTQRKARLARQREANRRDYAKRREDPVYMERQREKSRVKFAAAQARRRAREEERRRELAAAELELAARRHDFDQYRQALRGRKPDKPEAMELHRRARAVDAARARVEALKKA